MSSLINDLENQEEEREGRDRIQEDEKVIHEREREGRQKGAGVCKCVVIVFVLKRCLNKIGISIEKGCVTKLDM